MAAIGVAMIGFIFTDFNIKPSNEVAEINGNSYSIEDYRQEQNTLINFYKMNYGENLDPQLEQQIENETWRRMIRKSVMGKSYKQLGIEVSTDELKAMVVGDQSGTGNSTAPFSEPHPIVRQMFSNPETGEFNLFIMRNYFNSLDREEYAEERERWRFIENEIMEERMNQKYITLINKGLRPNSLDINDYKTENDKRVDFNYIAKNFSDIPDDEISFTEADLKSYYRDNIESYKSDEARTIEYVTFDVLPSEEDDANAELWTIQTKDEFRRTDNEDLVSYVNSVSDVPFDNMYYNFNEIQPILKDSLLTMPHGSIFGPYYENDAYKLSRISDTDLRPDSVRARHILIGYSIVGDIQRAEEIADSLFTVIENGGNFNAIAREYSADESNRNIGGDLGWFTEGTMEQTFNNACFENKSGDLVTATTRYGVHIIRIESQSRPVRKYQVATVVHRVIPSNETDQEIYNRAVKFRGKSTNLSKFEEQAREYGLDPRIVPDISKDQRTIAGLENPVNIIGWAYNAEEGDISNIFSINDRYIVAALTDVKEQGYEDFESVRTEIELAVKKQKKGEVIKERLAEKMENTGDLTALASSENLQVKEASQVQYANAYVTGIGMEPYIVGASMHLPPETMSGPYIGENSVFVISVTNREQGTNTARTASIKMRLNNAIQSRTGYEAYNTMMENADIEDNRLEVFYGR